MWSKYMSMLCVDDAGGQRIADGTGAPDHIGVGLAFRNLIGDVSKIREQQNALQEFELTRRADGRITARGIREIALFSAVERDNGLTEARIGVHCVQGIETAFSQGHHDAAGRARLKLSVSISHFWLFPFLQLARTYQLPH